MCVYCCVYLGGGGGGLVCCLLCDSGVECIDRRVAKYVLCVFEITFHACCMCVN